MMEVEADVGDYGGKDPRHLPTYPIGEAARYLFLPRSTLRTWVAGRDYPINGGVGHFQPLLDTPG